MLMNNNEYLDLVQTIKQEIQQAQYKATLSVNKELIRIGKNKQTLFIPFCKAY